MSSRAPTVEVTRLRWRDPPLAKIKLPGGTLRLTLGIGSGLSRAAGAPAGRIWGLGDRGPNLKIDKAVKTYGVTGLSALAGLPGAKLLPRPDLGPVLAELQVGEHRIELVRTLRLHDPAGRPVSGLAPPGDGEAEMEPVFDLQGHRLAADPGGADTEGVAALSDGGFWVAEEYGPSLMRVDADGVVRARWVPEGASLAGTAYPQSPVLPAIAARRRMNRGFEAVAVSPDQRWLFVCFQSALERPDGGAVAPFVRLWRLDAATGAVAAEHLYPFDPPSSFVRDAEAGKVATRDLKVCEIAALDSDRLLVLERIARSTKIYRVDLRAPPVPEAWRAAATSPALEELSAKARAARGVPVLAKTLMFSTDQARRVAEGLEGMAVLSDRELIVSTDNDFGVDGAETRFYHLRFDRPLTD
jgi:hypothetical protein